MDNLQTVAYHFAEKTELKDSVKWNRKQGANGFCDFWSKTQTSESEHQKGSQLQE